jgi:ceramide glucosyltransferase
MALGDHAKHHTWVVNDSDIRVDPGYLRRVTAPLADPRIGLVTCPYRARPHCFPAAWEAFGIAVDFIPSTLVAPLVGVREFGLGSTLAFRAEDLRRAGGFESFSDYLADDYQLAKHIVALGKRALLSTYVVETSLGEDRWRGVWRHQLRWARTIRASKGAGYAGLPITHAGVWILVLTVAHAWRYALLLWAVRTLTALLAGGFVSQSALAGAFCWLAPLWDLFAFAVWLGSYRSRRVEWRGKKLAIDKQGRIAS